MVPYCNTTANSHLLSQAHGAYFLVVGETEVPPQAWREHTNCCATVPLTAAQAFTYG